MASWLRSARRRWTAGVIASAPILAPRMPPGLIAATQRLLADAGPWLPGLAEMVARNMRSAGLYSEAVLRAHFEQVASHFCNGLRLFRLAASPGAVARLSRDFIDLDPSVGRIRQAMASGRGAVIAPPHVCNYLLTLVRLNQEVRVCVYLRWSKDERKQRIKHAWCRAAGLPVILEPPSAADPASRAALCVETLQRGEALVMTPDVAQRQGKGVPVRLFGRTAYLPAGPASIAMLAEAPLVPVFGHLGGVRHVICAGEPLSVERLPRDQGGRQGGLQATMQIWARQFEAFLRRDAQAWFLWADSRWTKVFQGRDGYASSVGETT